MKLGRVIGRVTLSRAVPALEGGRFLVVSPMGRDQYSQGLGGPWRPGPDPSLVVYDNLGGAVGQVIGYVEGREAAQPFDRPTPVDAINVALADELFYRPWTG
jgi:carbon dioxide concentrating mechanism protein CcmL